MGTILIPDTSGTSKNEIQKRIKNPW
jgi:hypothetical protein